MEGVTECGEKQELLSLNDYMNGTKLCSATTKKNIVFETLSLNDYMRGTTLFIA